MVQINFWHNSELISGIILNFENLILTEIELGTTSYIIKPGPSFFSLFSMQFVLPPTICLVSWILRIPLLYSPDFDSNIYEVKVAFYS